MFNPLHPGDGLKDDIKELGLSTADAARAIGVSRQQLHRVLAGTSGISAEMAVRLESVIGSSADHWMRLQSAYDLAQVRQHKSEIIKELTLLQAM